MKWSGFLKYFGHLECIASMPGFLMQQSLPKLFRCFSNACMVRSQGCFAVSG